MSPAKQKVSDVCTTHTTNIPSTSQSWRDLKTKRDETWHQTRATQYKPKNTLQKHPHDGKSRSRFQQLQLSGLHHPEHVWGCKAQWNNAFDFQPRDHQHHITEPPGTKHWWTPPPPPQPGGQSVELTKPLTKLNASLNLMAKEIHKCTYRPCWTTKIISPQTFTCGEKKTRETA